MRNFLIAMLLLPTVALAVTPSQRDIADKICGANHKNDAEIDWHVANVKVDRAKLLDVKKAISDIDALCTDLDSPTILNDLRPLQEKRDFGLKDIREQAVR